MKLLLISRLYSALRSSIENNDWSPSGMPAFCKLIEGLEEQKIEFNVILLCKTPERNFKKLRKLSFKEFKANFYIVPFCPIVKYGVNIWVWQQIANTINDLFQTCYCYRISKELSSDLIYCDRANVTIGAIYTYMLRQKVILRLHGIISLYEQFIRKRTKWTHPLKYLSYHAPFRYIIATQDGTPAEPFLHRFRNKSVPYQVLLNGIDDDIEPDKNIVNFRKLHHINENIPIILFVGRLEKSKGCDVFIKSLMVLKEKDDNFFAIIVGDGSLRACLVKLVKNSNLEKNVLFTGPVSHQEISQYFINSDIYVSLNFHGNLSNTVLEALTFNNAIVTFKADPVSKRDYSTEKILEDCAIFINRNNIACELPSALTELIANPLEVRKLKDSSSKVSDQALKPWNERIRVEIDIIKNIVIE